MGPVQGSLGKEELMEEVHQTLDEWPLGCLCWQSFFVSRKVLPEFYFVFLPSCPLSFAHSVVGLYSSSEDSTLYNVYASTLYIHATCTLCVQ